MVDAVILDVDGTLVDSVDLHAEAWQEALAHFGYMVPYARIREQIGQGADVLIPKFVPERELPHVRESLDLHRAELFRRNYLHKVRPFPGAKEFIQRLRADHKGVVLASSAQGEELQYLEKLLGVEVTPSAAGLDADVHQGEVAHSKPHPDLFEEALARLGHPPPNHCVVVGDTPYDALAARLAHVRCVGVLSGGFPEDTLWRAGCIQVFRDVAELSRAYVESDDAVFEGGVAELQGEPPVPL